jgi:outer membrane immunogenic protein
MSSRGAFRAAILGSGAAALMGSGAWASEPYAGPAFSWTGFYVGASVGGASTNQDYSHTPTGSWPISSPASVPILTDNGSGTLSGDSVTAGILVGYLGQSGNIVFGYEADFNGWDVSGRSVVTGPFPSGSLGTYTTEGDSDWFATFRGRLGVAFGRTLLYGTGGLAVGEVSISQSVFFSSVGSAASGSHTAGVTGWVAGGGIEFAVTKNWTVRGEYLHIDMGSVTTNLVHPTFPTFTHSVKSDLTSDVGRFAINYKF